jgi:bacterioferritin-associated ferredoxin
MIVCSCHAVSDHALRAAAANGLSHHEIVAATGAGTDCGQCHETVADIVTDVGPCRGAGACPDCPRRPAN